MMASDLVGLCRQATVLVEQTLLTRAQGSVRPASTIALIAVPTPELATGDERHTLGLAAVEDVQAILGASAKHSVSHTTGVSLVIGVADCHFGIDLERLTPQRPRIAQRVLTAHEMEVLGPGVTWLDVLRCFCVKEAVYKVLDEAEQDGLRFRGLQLERPSADSTRVHRSNDQRLVGHAEVAWGTDVVVALAVRPAF